VHRPAAGEKNMPIDYFFQSLAESRKDAAIGVILSGTATDATCFFIIDRLLLDRHGRGQGVQRGKLLDTALDIGIV